jgi:hypothetical protein
VTTAGAARMKPARQGISRNPIGVRRWSGHGSDVRNRPQRHDCPRGLQRPSELADVGPMVAGNGSQTIANELADLLDGAPPVPLLRDRVRVDRREIDRQLERLAEAVRSEVADHRLDKVAGYDLLQAGEAVRCARRNAYPIPLTDQVRLPGSGAAEMATALRAASQR